MNHFFEKLFNIAIQLKRIVNNILLESQQFLRLLIQNIWASITAIPSLLVALVKNTASLVVNLFKNTLRMMKFLGSAFVSALKALPSLLVALVKNTASLVVNLFKNTLRMINFSVVRLSVH